MVLGGFLGGNSLPHLLHPWGHFLEHLQVKRDLHAMLTEPLLGAELFPPGPEPREPLPSKQTLLLQILLLAVPPVLGNGHPGWPWELTASLGTVAIDQV